MKYCGGCRAGYDRVAAVADVFRQLGNGFEQTDTHDEESDLVIVITGCRTACADTSQLMGKLLKYISSIEDARRFIGEMMQFPGMERWP